MSFESVNCNEAKKVPKLEPHAEVFLPEVNRTLENLEHDLAPGEREIPPPSLDTEENDAHDTEIAANEESEFVGVSPDDEIDAMLDELQYGIKASLEATTPPDRDVLMTDFTERRNVSFKGSIIGRADYTLLVYAPVAFEFFRKRFSITTKDFINSVCVQLLHRSESKGSSGSKFYTTSDDRFILKTVPEKEADFLIELFPGYFLNLTQHSKTLLPKYYGLYTYKRGIRSVRFLIMNNILPRVHTYREMYDLKGSTYSKRKHCGKMACRNVPLKDLDFIERWAQGLYLRQKTYKTLFKSIERDCNVLKSHGIMDYSLLLGIVIPSKDGDSVENLKSFDSFDDSHHSVDFFAARTDRGETVYVFLGIIDILQGYSFMKKVESFVKSMRYKRSTVSVIPPDLYSRRFQEFLKNLVFKCIPRLRPCCKKECCAEIQKEDCVLKRVCHHINTMGEK